MTEEKIKTLEVKNDTCEEKAEQTLNEECSKGDDDAKIIDSLQNEVKAQNERFLRLAAEYDNYRKRSEKDKIAIYSDAKSKIVLEILPIGDCIERAIEASGDADDEYKKGLKMLNEQFNLTLSKLSVEPFGSEGDKFDPEIHNAISHIEDDELGENVIAKIFQKGYKFGDKIIRHAMVSVAN